MALNKADLLPAGYSPARVARWARTEARALGVGALTSVHVTSARTGAGVKELLADAIALGRRTDADVYVVGAANVGKSTLINQLLAGADRLRGGKALAASERSRIRGSRPPWRRRPRRPWPPKWGGGGGAGRGRWRRRCRRRRRRQPCRRRRRRRRARRRGRDDARGGARRAQAGSRGARRQTLDHVRHPRHDARHGAGAARRAALPLRHPRRHPPPVAHPPPHRRRTPRGPPGQAPDARDAPPRRRQGPLPRRPRAHRRGRRAPLFLLRLCVGRRQGAPGARRRRGRLCRPPHGGAPHAPVRGGPRGGARRVDGTGRDGDRRRLAHRRRRRGAVGPRVGGADGGGRGDAARRDAVGRRRLCARRAHALRDGGGGERVHGGGVVNRLAERKSRQGRSRRRRKAGGRDEW
ncbi:hypothetical protein BU14_0023s0083 [Porphyra umbilicalis]|uniref:Uncharacterized protein n=1 Tax=Porphyra umbilicalis TaxID=2786 RepID=A0A1X6PKA5_PORUM|nr:hypothetical protein BU14_0023s0083 [Porphyra umbilicalis]|eukprot:OSX81279.1 hypothetical protein BU14_0023s0083 [Porphyra umbilicalis]